MRPFLLTTLLLLSTPLLAAEPPATDKDSKLPLLFHTTLSTPDDLKKFTFTDPAAWKLADDTVAGKKQPVLSLFQQSKFKPPHRSPVNIAWINDLKVTHFVMEVRCKSTQKPIPNRDVCFFFGHVDPARFCYAHLAQQKSASHNDLFVVDAADRAPVSTKRSDGTPWSDGYHTIRVARDDAGTKVFFDGQLMLATDSKALPAGGLGMGSFDDVANFAEITVWGKKAE